VSLVLEGYSLRVAVAALRKRAKQQVGAPCRSALLRGGAAPLGGATRRRLGDAGPAGARSP
jgi:hypothetical protein